MNISFLLQWASRVSTLFFNKSDVDNLNVKEIETLYYINHLTKETTKTRSSFTKSWLIDKIYMTPKTLKNIHTAFVNNHII